MEVIAAVDAKTNFGALLEKAQQEPVRISDNGRDVAVIISTETFNAYQEMKWQLLQRDIRKGLEDLERGAIVDGDKVFRALELQFG